MEQPCQQAKICATEEGVGQMVSENKRSLRQGIEKEAKGKKAIGAVNQMAYPLFLNSLHSIGINHVVAAILRPLL